MASDPGSIPREVANQALLTNLPFFGIACITMLTGVCALVLARLRSRERLFLWAGSFSILYAARLFIGNDLVRAAFDKPGHWFVPWILGITYAINIPFVLFVLELLGRGWKGLIEIWLWLTVIFAAIAIPTAILAPNEHWTDPLNKVLVIGGALLILIHVFVARRKGNALAASIVWPLVTFCIFILLENEGVRLAGLSLEPVGFMILLAGFVWVAVKRALTTERKLIDIEQELATARRIQSSIIPHTLPSVSSIEIATRYQPMTAVAGDFYDFLHTADHLLTVLIADVSGHGVPAALVASMLKVCFAAQKEHAGDPAKILSGLHVMLRGSLSGQYVTAACAAIDTKARMITYAAAGHPPSLLLRQSEGEIFQLAENGLFIGPFPHATYANMSARFQAGDRLLLYTDGIVEAPGPNGEEFGSERLEEFLASAVTQDPAAVIEGLFQKISHGAQQDDLTAVLMQFG